MFGFLARFAWVFNEALKENGRAAQQLGALRETPHSIDTAINNPSRTQASPKKT